MPAAAETRLRIRPTLEEARALARDHALVPVTHTFVDDVETPVSAFLKLRGDQPAFLLESAERGQAVGRWSFIGHRPREVIRWQLGDEGDPYAIAAEAAARPMAPLDGLPPFAGGAVGFFGFDLVRTVEPLGDPNPDVLGLPDMALMLTEGLVAFDHLKHTITVLATMDASGDADAEYARAVEAIEDVRRRLAGPVPRPAEPPGERAMPEFVPNMPREAFEAMVARIVRYVHAGDAFQVVPSQRWSAEVPCEAFSIYRGLRAVNPSPYMYYLDFGDFEIAGASPEPLLTVTGRHVSTRPIAGTRPRGATAAEDLEIAAELLADPKERAEHVMLVDLGRNDLGRVSEYGSVSVDTFMAVETYSHVMHIVSNVSGTLSEGIGAIDALRSVLPAGTLSGAPKVRAMEIIDELEPVKRGGYGGAIGYLSYSGDLDTCIHIRTVVVKDGVAHIQAGGGTVADARPTTSTRSRAPRPAPCCRRSSSPGAARLALMSDSTTPATVRARLAAPGGPRREGPVLIALFLRRAPVHPRVTHIRPRRPQNHPSRCVSSSSTTTTRSPTTSSSSSGSSGPRSRSCATTARRSTSCCCAATTASSSRPARARRRRRGSPRRSCGASPRRASRRSASASATSRWPAPSAARSSRASRSTARSPRSSTTGRACTPDCPRR